MEETITISIKQYNKLKDVKEIAHAIVEIRNDNEHINEMTWNELEKAIKRVNRKS